MAENRQNDATGEASTTTPQSASDNTKVVTNEVSEETGEFDTRFLLWRSFCDETGVLVDSLPSELKGELRERWDKMKDNELHKPTEAASTPPVTN